MKPVFSILADGTDITRLINDRLLMLRTVDKPGMESDEFELRIDDRDGAVALPKRGASIEISLGYEGQALAKIGRYTVDKVQYVGPPDTIVVRGKAGDNRGTGKTTRSGSWEGVPLSQIVADVAARNGWKPECTVATQVERVDQLRESDYHFITRLARRYDCTAKLAAGRLVVLPRQSGQTASGKTLGSVTITRKEVGRFQFDFDDRDIQAAARATYQDKNTGKLVTVDVVNDDAGGLPPVHTDRHIHRDKTAALQAAKARLTAFNRSTAGVRLEMPGRTDLFAERTVVLPDFKEGINGDYLVDSVEQTFTKAGWSTTVECNGGKRGKAKAAGKKKKKEPETKVVEL